MGTCCGSRWPVQGAPPCIYGGSLVCTCWYASSRQRHHEQQCLNLTWIHCYGFSCLHHIFFSDQQIRPFRYVVSLDLKEKAKHVYETEATFSVKSGNEVMVISSLFTSKVLYGSMVKHIMLKMSMTHPTMVLTLR